jgi:multiple sugar transport system substrate-binding protein
MFARAPAAAAALTAGGGLLATACGGPTGEAPPGTPGPAGAPQTLRVGHWRGTQFDETIRAFSEAFKIRVENEPSPFDGYHDKLVVMTAAGSAPDASFISTSFIGPLAEARAALDLGPYLRRDKEIRPEKWAIDPALDSGWRGVTLGLPQWHPDSANVYVNKQLTGAAGLRLPEFGTPEFNTWTWPQFTQAALATTKRAADGRAEQWGVAGLAAPFWSPYRDAVWSNGAELFDDPLAQQPKAARFTDAPFVEAVQYLVDLTTKHRATTLGEEASLPAAQPALLSGKVAFTWMWNNADVLARAPFDATVLPSPVSPARRLRPNKYGGNSWAVGGQTKAADAAWTFVSWCAAKAGQKLIAKVGALQAYDPEALLPLAPNDRFKLVWQVTIQRARDANRDKIARPYALGVKDPQVATILQAQMQRVYAGEQSVPAALTGAKQEVDALLRG